MKTKFTFKSLLVITCLLLSINVYAQDVPPITLHVETAGTLPNLIAANRKYEITDLTLTGNLNGTDIRFIREMAGRDVSGKETNGKLTKLNLAGANIVSGGWNYYYDTSGNYHYTSTNRISDYMFSGCTGLTSITIPNSVTSISTNAFSTGLKEFIVFEQNQNYSSDEGVLLNKEKTIIIKCPISKQGSYVIPNSVITIESNAFQNCSGLTNITIGNNVTTIGSYAFYGCTGLTNVTIPNSVITIEDSAFAGCAGLTNVTIGNSVITIRNYAFSGCTRLSDITIPNSLTSIGMYVFHNCTGLTRVVIGNSINSINNTAFSGCTGLKEFIVFEQNQNYSSDEGVLLNKEKTTIINYPMGKQGSYVIPNSVTSIGSGVFQGRTGLTNITIPNSVTSIGSYAFSGCTGLTEIHCKNPQPITIYANVFGYVNKTTCRLYVPKGSYTAYWLAPVWSDFINIIEEDATAIQTINKEIASIHSTSNGIYIDTKETASIVVYNLSGQTVYQNVVNGSAEITLDKGVYIVRVNNESQKVIVR